MQAFQPKSIKLFHFPRFFNISPKAIVPAALYNKVGMRYHLGTIEVGIAKRPTCLKHLYTKAFRAIEVPIRAILKNSTKFRKCSTTFIKYSMSFEKFSMSIFQNSAPFAQKS